MTWPPERFYWSVIDLPGWRKSGPVPPALLHEAQHDLPLDVGELHAVCMPLAGGGLLVCAARRDELADVDATTVTLTPSNVPTFVTESGDDVPKSADDRKLGPDTPDTQRIVTYAGTELPDPSLLNLLVGEFEASPIRRSRARKHGLRMVTTVVCVVLVFIGLERRTRLLTRQAALSGASLDARTHRTSRTVNADELALQLAALTPLRVAAAKIPLPTDAAMTLASLLRLWPTTTAAVPQAVSITPSMITISVAVPGSEGAPEFLRNFRPPDGWQLDEPRVSAGKDSSRVMLELHPLMDARRIP